MGRWAAPLAILAAGILVISQSIPSRGEVGSTELYGEVPRPVGSLQLEPEHWSSEDAAEHAFNLELWRVELLKAKVAQADLRKKLFDASSVPTVEGLGPRRGRKRLYASPHQLSNVAGGADSELKAEAQEIAGLRADLVGVASSTARALQRLKRDVDTVRPDADIAAGDRRVVRRVPREKRSRVPVEGRREEAERHHAELDAGEARENEQGHEAVGQWMNAKGLPNAAMMKLRSKVMSMMASLTKAVTLAKQDRQVQRDAKRDATLVRLEKSEGKQLTALAQEVKAAVAKKNAERQAKIRRAAEAERIVTTLGAMQTAASKAVQRHGGDSNKRRAARVMAVKQAADKELDALLAKVDKEIARKKWKESLPPPSRPA